MSDETKPKEEAPKEEAPKEEAPKNSEVEGLKAEVTKLREQRREARDEVKDLKDENATLQAQLAEGNPDAAELQTLRDKVTQLEGDLETERTRQKKKDAEDKVKSLASELGFRKPEYAIRLLDADPTELDEDELKEQVGKLLEEDPGLKGTGTPTPTPEEQQPKVVGADPVEPIEEAPTMQGFVGGLLQGARAKRADAPKKSEK